MQPTTMTTPPRITTHCKEQAADKGWTLDEVFLAHTEPFVCYPSGKKYPGQQRHIRGDIAVVVDAARNLAITVYLNVKETPMRPDQIAKGERKAS